MNRRTTRSLFLALLSVMAMSLPAGSQQQSSAAFLADLDRASHVVVPQSRGFPLYQSQAGLVIDGVRSRVRILEQTASTTLDISLRNSGHGNAEAVLLLPVPDGAAVHSFLFDGAAREPTARLLNRDEARRLYDSIVARIKDPALLEFAGYNLIRSSVFPVPAGGTQRIQVTYEHLLEADGPRVDYILPRSESLDVHVPWTFEVEVQSKDPISTVYSPTHDVTTTRIDERRIRVQVPAVSASDPGRFQLSYLRAGDGLAASLFAYPDPKVGGGYFLLMAGLPAKSARDHTAIRREVTLVIDRSGSMAGPKMDQVRAAALQVIEGLEDGEAFNLIDYATTVSSFAERPVIKSRESTLQAREYLDALRTTGGTNIHDALLEALRQDPHAGMLPIVLFLTDGLPTVGQTGEVAIRQLVEKGNLHGRRLFTFGVGEDVNVPLLDGIADITRASSEYVLPGEDVELKVAATFRRLSGPLLADAKVETLGPDGQPSTRLVRELIPSAVPDLFDGDQLILLGQYQRDGALEFRLTGNYLGHQRTFAFQFDLHKATTKNAFVPRLWASRRIAYLVDQVRQLGAGTGFPPLAGSPVDPRLKELTDEILRLSTEFGILSEYTAFLATEGTDLGNWSDLLESCQLELDERAVKQRFGLGAVTQGRNFNDRKLQSKLNYDNRFWNDKAERVEVSAVQQVNDRAFFQNNGQWVDAQIIARKAQLDVDEVVPYGSARHREILGALILQNRQGCLSLSGEILLQYEGKNILVKNEQ